MARVKEVFGSHAQTAHVWAQGEYTIGRSSDSRMFFENGTIYSYGRHFPIAKISETVTGERVYLFTTRRYSVSTGKHISLTQRALRSDVPVFMVTHPNDTPEANIKEFDAEVQNYLANYTKPRIRQSTRDHVAAQIASATHRRNEYGAAFIKKYKPISVPENIVELAEKLQKEKEAKAKREAKELAKRKEAEIKHAEEFTHTNRNEWADMWRDKDTSKIVGMLSGVCTRYIKENHGILLRLKDYDQTIQTSAGAEFPVTHAKRAFKAITAVRAKKEPWQRNGKTIHLGHFQIDSIDALGNVKAGCHTVRWEEIKLMAEKLGVA